MRGRVDKASSGGLGMPGLPCVWARVGVVPRRLCDLELACEVCPLDAALRGRPPPLVVPQTLHGFAGAVVFPADRRYGSGHTWCKPAVDGRATVGVDGLAAQLLSEIESVSLPRVGERLARGAPLARVTAGQSELRLYGPVGGVAVAVNDQLERAPEAVSQDPYGAGWIAEIQLENDSGGGAVRR